MHILQNKMEIKVLYFIVSIRNRSYVVDKTET